MEQSRVLETTLDLVRNPETWHILEKPSLPAYPSKIAIG
jgi:hypothetical protein